jgi:hypothetical protein
MGQALTIEHQLDPVEREVLNRLEGRIAVPELLTISDEGSVLAAIRSLLRRRLACIDIQRPER